MAETSGFMTDLPQSAYLSLSIRRAISAAQQRSHRYVTLEHLLLALLDDPDALALFEAIRADIPAIRSNATDTVNRNLATLYTPGQFDLRASYKVERVLQTASDDANRLNCSEVDAAFVLSALSRESDNPAADILKRNGFTYPAAMTWLYGNRGQSYGSRTATARAQSVPAADPSPPPAPAPQPVRSEPPRAPEPEPEPEPEDEEPDELELEVIEDEAEEEPAPPPPPPVPVAKVPRPGQGAGAAARIAHSVAQPAARAVENKSDFRREQRAAPEAPPVPTPPPNPAPHRQTVNGAREAAPAASAPRPSPQMPSQNRLDEMRVGSAGRAKVAAPAPAPAPPPVQPASRSAKQRSAPSAKVLTPASAERQKGRSRRAPRPHEALIGRLIENIPRRMRALSAERIEVRISREETQAMARGLEGSGQPVRHEIMITQAMSVILRAPDSGFMIEPLSPETQWIFDRPDGTEGGEVYGRWRWSVTPMQTGQHRLQLIVAARSIDQNGLVGDVALPDQVITVRVRTNYWRLILRSVQWLAAMALGGVVTELAMLGMKAFAH
ncbi:MULTISPECIES: Clp protease N-terminal domain-containing protein [Rhodomicrobium]|uniref:Clp protease N-terminal domain-containing protein n=1 Tax=Rhodomicrobium TaxID=1068 RepID=UPI0014821131|nr:MULTISPECIES: Clp protease N-terminal domain-containing protein [Rhodomicrobium]